MNPPSWAFTGRQSIGCLHAGAKPLRLARQADLTPGFGVVALQHGRTYRGYWFEQAILGRALRARVLRDGKPGVGGAWRVIQDGPMVRATYRWDWRTREFWLERTGRGFA